MPPYPIPHRDRPFCGSTGWFLFSFALSFVSSKPEAPDADMARAKSRSEELHAPHPPRGESSFEGAAPFQPEYLIPNQGVIQRSGGVNTPKVQLRYS